MIRAVLLGLLVVSVPACSKGDATPAATTGAAAGKVVELSGAVTATRDGKVRDLKQGDEVTGDDVIATTADAKVAIELFHNNARWSLGANKSGKVSESSAWSLAKADKPADISTGDTSAAGRHAEKSATETGATAAKAEAMKDEAPPEMARAAVAPQADVVAGGAPGGPPTTAMAPGAPGGPPPMTTPLPPPPPPVAQPKPALNQPKADPPPPPKDTARKVGGDDDGVAVDGKMDEKESAPKTAHRGALDPHATIANDAAMKACLGTLAADAKIVVGCKAGVCTITSATNVDAKAKVCMTARLAKLGLTGTVDVTVTFAK